MMTETDNVALIREAYEQWHDSRGASVGKWLDLMSHGVRFRSLAGGAAGLEFSRDCASRDDVARYFAELGNDWDMIHYTVDELIAQGDRVVMLGSCGWKNRRTGIAVQTAKADFLRLKDGKVVEFFEFFDTAQAMAASLGTAQLPAG
ncbi:MAG TPA: nuclear transport factor 2 family protein [Rudaea sp.]|jgi:ketosteroid isomerase-like protein|nr:nuclear transport factor 2 family protein [Rudaea sp.]